MMNPLSSERHSAGAVMAFDGQTELNSLPSKQSHLIWDFSVAPSAA